MFDKCKRCKNDVEVEEEIVTLHKYCYVDMRNDIDNFRDSVESLERDLNEANEELDNIMDTSVMPFRDLDSTGREKYIKDFAYSLKYEFSEFLELMKEELK